MREYTTYLYTYSDQNNANYSVGETLKIILQELQAERGLVFEFDPATKKQRLFCKVLQEGCSDIVVKMDKLELLSRPWSGQRLLQRLPIIVSNLSDLPDEAGNVRASLEAMGTSAVMVAPILNTDDITGFVYVDVTKINREWSDADQKCFLALCRIVGNNFSLRSSEKNRLLTQDKMFVHEPPTSVKDLELQFNDVFQLAGIGLCKWNPLKNEFDGTDQWFKNLNVNRSEVATLPEIIKCVHLDDITDLGTSYQGFVDGSLLFAQRTFRVKDGDGWKWLLSFFKARKSKQQKNSIDIFELNLDISDFKIHEENLMNSIKKAEEADRFRSAFIANISHEIRTPLNAIVGLSGMLNEVEDPAERCKYVTIIEENTNLLLRLISDIIYFSRMETEEKKSDQREIDIRLFLEELITPYKLKSFPDLKLVVQAGLPPCTILADRSKLYQILTNLLNNALEFTQKGTIQIGYVLKDFFVEFYVEDSGIGISPEKVFCIFDRFVKLDEFSKGTGLGLSICRSLVEDLGGKIKAESELGKGSRFSFTVPYGNRNDNETGKDETPMAEEQPDVKKIPTILVAEDTDSNFALVSILLRKEYHIFRAINGIEAVKLHAEIHPDLILMDIQMPELNGLDATRLIREIDKDVPIIALTAFAFDSDKQAFKEAGGTDYMSKPIDPDELRNLVRQII